MKKYMIAAALTLPFSIFKSNAQVSGNAKNEMGNAQYNAARANPTSAARFSGENSNDSTIVVTVKGLINIMPDTYVATFNVVQTGETAEVTDRLMLERISKFKTGLVNAGISEGEINVDMISFVPKYDIETENRLFSKTSNEIPAGFEMQKNLSIRYKKADQLDRMVTIAAQNEIYDLVKVDYFHTRLESFKDSLRTSCLAALRKNIRSYEALNLKLDTLKKTVQENFHTISPSSRYFSYQAFSRTSVKPVKKNGAQTNINEIEKTVSRYYLPLGFESFDIVMNPVVLEPVIQVSYQITVSYKLKPTNRYYIITPAGESKKLLLN